MKTWFGIWLSMCFLLPVAGQEEEYVELVDGTDHILEMVPIPAGTFTMGSAENAPGHQADEGPQREFRVDGFWMSSHEITWDLYQLYLNRNSTAAGYSQDLDAESGETEMTDEDAVSGETIKVEFDAMSGATMPYVDMSLGMGTDPGLPAGNVTRKAASSFCQWLSARTGHFYRLPTEAEWEYAARAGSAAPYFFGTEPDSLDAYAWYAGNSDGRYREVGQKKPSPWGLYDIYGNVAEWTLDGYDPEGYADTGGEFVVPVSEYPGVLRGGSFREGPGALRSAARLPSDPLWKQRDPQFPRSKWWFTDAPFAGFRVVRPYTPPPASEYARYWDTK